VLLLGGLGLAPAPAWGQQARLRVDENVRFEPQGTIIGRLQAGTPVRIEEDRGPWSRVTFEGAIWAASVQRRTTGTFEYIVTASDGENLRQAPQGAIIGRLSEGTLLNERRDAGAPPASWVLVRRTAWIWNASLDRTGSAGGATTAAPTPAPARAPATGTPPAPAQAPPPAPAAQWLRVAPGGGILQVAPDGDTLAVLQPGTELQLLGREGGWARVRMEGWVWMPGAAQAPARAPASGPASDVVLRGVRPVELTREPDRFRGRLVEITLQFISVERAEAIRVDFQEGEPFLLTRSPEADRTFVYLALSPALLVEARRLSPLDRIVVVGRVRATSASLTGNPILDLVELRRVR
jgi:hypothetical protein